MNSSRVQDTINHASHLINVTGKVNPAQCTWPVSTNRELETRFTRFRRNILPSLLFYRELVRVSVLLRATYRPGPRIVVLYAEAGSGRAILMNDSLGKHEGQRVLWT
jgi:hypothetical protein